MAIRQAQNLAFNAQIREKEKQESDAKEALRTRLILVTCSITIGLLTFLLWHRIRQLRLRHKMVLELKRGRKAEGY